MKKILISLLALTLLSTFVLADLSPSALNCLQSDANSDLKVNSSDYQYISQYIYQSGCSISNNWCSNADVSREGYVNYYDMFLVSQKIGCELIDSDVDGIKDIFDMCPNTPRLTKVDSVGCSANDFCSKITGNTNGVKCLVADWKGNEARQMFPSDCQPTWDYSVKPMPKMYCVATSDAN